MHRGMTKGCFQRNWTRYSKILKLPLLHRMFFSSLPCSNLFYRTQISRGPFFQGRICSISHEAKHAIVSGWNFMGTCLSPWKYRLWIELFYVRSLLFEVWSHQFLLFLNAGVIVWTADRPLHGWQSRHAFLASNSWKCSQPQYVALIVSFLNVVLF